MIITITVCPVHVVRLRTSIGIPGLRTSGASLGFGENHPVKLTLEFPDSYLWNVRKSWHFRCFHCSGRFPPYWQSLSHVATCCFSFRSSYPSDVSHQTIDATLSRDSRHFAGSFFRVSRTWAFDGRPCFDFRPISPLRSSGSLVSGASPYFGQSLPWDTRSWPGAAPEHERSWQRNFRNAQVRA